MILTKQNKQSRIAYIGPTICKGQLLLIGNLGYARRYSFVFVFTFQWQYNQVPFDLVINRLRSTCNLFT